MINRLPDIVWQRDTFTNDLGLHLRLTGFIDGKEFCFIWKPNSVYVTAFARGLDQLFPVMSIVRIDALEQWFHYHL